MSGRTWLDIFGNPVSEGQRAYIKGEDPKALATIIEVDVNTTVPESFHFPDGRAWVCVMEYDDGEQYNLTDTSELITIGSGWQDAFVPTKPKATESAALMGDQRQKYGYAVGDFVTDNKVLARALRGMIVEIESGASNAWIVTPEGIYWNINLTMPGWTHDADPFDIAWVPMIGTIVVVDNPLLCEQVNVDINRLWVVCKINKGSQETRYLLYPVGGNLDSGQDHVDAFRDDFVIINTQRSL